MDSLPDGWSMQRSKGGDIVFRHSETGKTQLERPGLPEPQAQPHPSNDFTTPPHPLDEDTSPGVRSRRPGATTPPPPLPTSKASNALIDKMDPGDQIPQATEKRNDPGSMVAVGRNDPNACANRGARQGATRRVAGGGSDAPGAERQKERGDAATLSRTVGLVSAGWFLRDSGLPSQEISSFAGRGSIRGRDTRISSGNSPRRGIASTRETERNFTAARETANAERGHSTQPGKPTARTLGRHQKTVNEEAYRDAAGITTSTTGVPLDSRSRATPGRTACIGGPDTAPGRRGSTSGGGPQASSPSAGGAVARSASTVVERRRTSLRRKSGYDVLGDDRPLQEEGPDKMSPNVSSNVSPSRRGKRCSGKVVTSPVTGGSPSVAARIVAREMAAARTATAGAQTASPRSRSEEPPAAQGQRRPSTASISRRRLSSTVMGKVLCATVGRRGGGATESSLGATAGPTTQRARSFSPNGRTQTHVPGAAASTYLKEKDNGTQVVDTEGAPGYRAFVEERFTRGSGVRRFKQRSKVIAELMCHTAAAPKQALLSSTPDDLADAAMGMFRYVQVYMGDAEPSENTCAGDENSLRSILFLGRSNMHLACELYCQLVKQTHRCPVAHSEENGFLILACAAELFPPPAEDIASLVLGHLALHRTRPCPAGGLALYTHHQLSSTSASWGPTIETGAMVLLTPQMRDCARNCFVPGKVFRVTIEETLRQEYYIQGIGEITSPAPSSASETSVPVLVQLFVQVIDCLGGLRTEGIFRRSGHAGAQAALIQSVRAGDYTVLRRLRDHGTLRKGDLPGDEKFDVDVYTVANALKAWLRCMKDPLVPAESYSRAVKAGLLSDGSQAQEEALRVLLALPTPNRATLEFLARFLSKVAAHEDANRMGSQGLALVLSPNLLRNPGENALVFQANAKAETSFVRSLIEGSKQ